MGSIQQIFGILYPYLPHILVTAIFLILAILALLFVIFRSAKKKETPPEQAGAETPEQAGEKAEKPVAKKVSVSVTGLRGSFSRALRMLRANVPGRNYRYQIPWCLMMGGSETGKTTALKQSGLNLPLGKPIGKGPEVRKNCNWWFFEKGIVLDLAGDLVLREDGKSSDERGWRLFLRLLQRYRPERPLDSVIVTIPCTDLVDGKGQAGPDLTVVAEKADLIYKKLWQAQKALGIRFPVYFLVTKCDAIEGFQSFCREMPERLNRNIFGWSNPHALDSGYTADWVSEAFRDIHNELSHTQFEMFTEGTGLKESDGLFVFPTNFQALSEPLQVYADHIFKQSVYHESFVLRGIYFCGDSGTEMEREGPRRTFFLQDLFQKKVFTEFGLAGPAARTLVSRNRKVLTAQVIAALIVLVGGLGLWRGYHKLQVDKKALVPVLEQIAMDVEKTRDKWDMGQEGLRLYNLLRQGPARISFEESTRHLFEGMTNVSSLESLAIPSSWFSDIHEQIRHSMTLAYDTIILKAMYIQLLQKAKAIFETTGNAQATGRGLQGLVRVEESPEFSELRTFVENLAELERYASIYNGLRTSRNLTDLGRVAKYLFGFDLPEGFYRNAKYYHEALGETEYRVFDPKIFQIKAKFFTLRKLTQKLYDRLFHSNPISAYLQVLALQLDNFGTESRSAPRDGRMIRDLLDTITQTEKILAEPALAWMGNEGFSLGPSFDNLLSSVEESLFLGPDMRAEVQETGEKAFYKLREELKTKTTTLTGPLLKREGGEVILALSSNVVTLKTDLEKLLMQEFMTLEPTEGRKFEIPSGMRLTWDTGLLEEAVKLIQPYEGFIRTGLRSLPGELPDIIKNMAQHSLEVKMLDLIARAQRFESLATRLSGHSQEVALRTEIRNFREASKLLNRLLVAFDRLDLVESYLDLSDLAEWQTSTLLESADQLLMEEDLYAMKKGDFSWWEGTGPVAYAAFDVSGEEELKHYLGLQRERIRHLAYEYVEPVIAFLLNSNIPRNRTNRGALFRWEKILSELDKFESRKPDNSITVLETYVLFDINQIDKVNFFEKIARKDLSERSGDFFLQRRNHLRRLIYARCQSLAAQEISGEYAKVGTLFNRKLAGRFPFAENEGGKVFMEADPADIRDFYLTFKGFAGDFGRLMSLRESHGISAEKAFDFMKQMKDLRGFFASFLDGVGEEKKKEELPLFDFLVEFRVNQGHEIGGNHIIEWRLTVGDQEFRYMGDKMTGRWRLGDPIRLNLRWAKDSVEFPLYVMGHSGVKIDERTVEYSYKNKWSLVSFLKNHVGSPADFDGLADPKPHTLKFVIETGREERKKQDEEGPKTEVFIRMTPLVPDGKKSEIVVMPTLFPVRAPALSPTGSEG